MPPSQNLSGCNSFAADKTKFNKYVNTANWWRACVDACPYPVARSGIRLKFPRHGGTSEAGVRAERTPLILLRNLCLHRAARTPKVIISWQQESTTSSAVQLCHRLLACNFGCAGRRKWQENETKIDGHVFKFEMTLGHG